MDEVCEHFLERQMRFGQRSLDCALEHGVAGLARWETRVMRSDLGNVLILSLLRRVHVP